MLLKLPLPWIPAKHKEAAAYVARRAWRKLGHWLPRISLPPRSLRSPPGKSLSLQLAYQLVEAPAKVDKVFLRLRSYLYGQYLSQRQAGQAFPALALEGPRFLWEAGQLHPGRAYFYIKPLNRMGWLFERSGLGWVVSRCEKIVGDEMFLRQENAWDIVTLYEQSAPNKDEHFFRVASLRHEGDLLSYLVYERRVKADIFTDEFFGFEGA